jgi:hypothetical protein
MKSFGNFEFPVGKWFIFQNRIFGMWQTIPLKVTSTQDTRKLGFRSLIFEDEV